MEPMNDSIRETCQSLGCRYYKIDIDADPNSFKSGDVVHLSYDVGLPNLLNSIKFHLGAVPTTVIPSPSLSTSASVYKERKRTWYDMKRKAEYTKRSTKRSSHQLHLPSSNVESFTSTPSITTAIPRNEDIDEILKEIGPHPVIEHSSVFSDVKVVKTKGKLHNLDSFPNFTGLLRCLHRMTTTASGSPPCRYVQYTDAKGSRFFLSLEDLLTIKSAYIDSLILMMFAASFFQTRKVINSPCQISRYGGGNGRKDDESKLIEIRKKTSESDLMKIPPFSACKDSYTIVIESENSVHFDDITQMSQIPSVPTCEKMLKELNKHPMNKMSIQTSDGTVLTMNSLNIILNYKDEIRAKNEILQEKAWLREIQNKNIPCPPGLSVQPNLRYVQEALNYLHGDISGAERGTYENLRFDSIRGVVSNNYITDDFLAHISNKVNVQSPSNVFCFFYDRMDVNTYEISETVLQEYRLLEKDAIQLVVFCRVRNVVVGENRAFTHIGDFITEQGTCLVADHYVMLVFDYDFQTVTYCDSLGWKAPPDLSDFISTISKSFFNQKLFCNIIYGHSPSNLANLGGTHICKEGICSKYYPLQTCGRICGVAVLIPAIIAVFDFACFRKLFSTAENLSEKFVYLRDISRYSTFYRSVLLKWLKNDISINDIIPNSSAEVQSPCSIQTPTTHQMAQKSFQNDVAFTMNEFMIPLNANNDVLLSDDSNLSLNLLGNNFLDQCNPKDLNCTKKGSHLHCKLCNMKIVLSKNVSNHITKHKKNGVKGTKYFYFSCTSDNHTITETNRSHYHCGFCEKVIIQKDKFQTHLRTHQKDGNRKAEKDLLPLEEFITQPPIKKIQIERNVQCPVCDLVLLSSSLKRHMTKHDKNIVPESVTVDRNRGIYMVPKSPHHGGIRYPIHVQKVMNKTETKIFCEHPDCVTHHRILRESGGLLTNCDHLELVKEQSTLIKEPVKLNEDFWDSDICPIANTFTKETIKRCCELNNIAIIENYPVIVPFIPNANHVHLSVWTNQKDDPCAKLGRVIVTYNKITRKISCGCSLQNRIPCDHKVMALWFLYQTSTIESNHKIGLEEISNEESSTAPVAPKGISTGIQNNENVRHQKSNSYPPKQSENIERMIEYLHSHKRYSKVDLECIVDFRLKLHDKRIVPSETKCIHCDVSLQAPLRVNKNAKVLTFSYGLVGNYSVYVKKCPSCQMFYRYQECTDGIHNVDDDLFVENRIYMFMKENLQEHNSIGGTVKSLNRLPGMTKKLDEKRILDGYFMFDVLSTNDHPFFCDQCGHHPHILVADLNRKLAFRCDMDDVEDVEDINDETAGDVDCDKYWADVECNILASAFPGSVKTKFSIKPSFKYWSPYMGKNTRKSNILLNSEYRKVNRKTGTFDSEYLKELSEERLFELVSQKPLKVLKNIAKDMKMTNFSGKNRRELLNAIQSNLPGDNQSIGKLFLNMGGFSGGYLTYNCIHGISYYLKMPIRAEGPRDYIDGYLSMKHPPNVTIIDMPHLLVQHSRSRENDIIRTNSGNDEGELFFPFEGRAGDSNDQENVLKANENKFKSSIPCLSGESSDRSQDTGPLSHPVTGSSVRMALFDRFHENNSKSEIEDLRKLQCVKELYGQVNSQVAEQLHKSFNSNKRFLNAMSPHNFAFLLRSMLNHRNGLKNAEFVEKQKSKGYDIYRNELGGIRLKLGFDRTFTNLNITESNSRNNIDFMIGTPNKVENNPISDENGVDTETLGSTIEGDGGDMALLSNDGVTWKKNHDITEEESRNIFDIFNQSSDITSSSKGKGMENKCDNISFHFPALVLREVFEFYCAGMNGNLRTLKLVCKNWKEVADEIPRHILNVLSLSNGMRIIESKPEYKKLYRHIYNALLWLLRERSILKRFPRLPNIIYSNEEYLYAAHSFLILRNPDRTFNGLQHFNNELEWYDDCLERFQDKQCFDFDCLEDMKCMLNKTRDIGIHINAKHDNIITANYRGR